MTATAGRRPIGRSGRRPAAVGATALLSVLAVAGPAGFHRAAGSGLVVLMVLAALEVVRTRLDGLDPVPALVLAAVGSMALLVLGVVAAAVVVPIDPASTVAVVSLLTVSLTAAAARPAGAGRVARRSGRAALFAGLTVAACGLLAVDAGAVTARLAPRAGAAPFTSFSYAGAAARWDRPVPVAPGTPLEVPVRIANHSGAAGVFTVTYRLGARTGVLAEADVASGGTWSGRLAVPMPDSGCPDRLAVAASGRGGTDSLDATLQWPATATCD